MSVDDRRTPMRIAVLGAGSWGTALALHAQGVGHDVRLWTRRAEAAEALASARENIAYLPGVELPAALQISADELLGLKPHEKGPMESDPELRKTWKKFQKVMALPERDQRAVIRLINSLASAQQVTQENLAGAAQS